MGLRSLVWLRLSCLGNAYSRIYLGLVSGIKLGSLGLVCVGVGFRGFGVQAGSKYPYQGSYALP